MSSFTTRGHIHVSINNPHVDLADTFILPPIHNPHTPSTHTSYFVRPSNP